ncbi:heterokaryon incompatibility protein-domain-containing protein [Xylariomycetidae sp. FL0641]|nr:heterokaryon incompatibility protein-domain-containing protein [Xylariomycetidae sp. FL0641]
MELLDIAPLSRSRAPAPWNPYWKLSEKGAIRLLYVERGNWLDPLRCTLRTKSLSQPPQYDALSYAWGSSGAKRPLDLGVFELQITANLESALRHLRRVDREIMLWADAVCINQDWLDERASQVKMMRDIYAAARHVLVFLGDGYNHGTLSPTDQALPPVERVFQADIDDQVHTQYCPSIQDPNPWRIGKTRWEAYNVFRFISLLPRKPALMSLLSTIGPEKSGKLFQAFRMMLLSRWWTRVWVFQEAIVAQTVIVQYGGVTAPWTMLAYACEALKSSMTKTSGELASDDLKTLHFYIKLVGEIEEGRRLWHHTPCERVQEGTANLLSLLRSTCGRQASDDRHRVYALVGLVEPRIDMELSYGASVARVYSDVIRNILNGTGYLDGLVGDLGRKNRRDLPSWVPDWTASMDATDVQRARASKLFNACGNTRFICLTQPPDEESILHHEKQVLMEVTTGHNPELADSDLFAGFRRTLLGSRSVSEALVEMTSLHRLQLACMDVRALPRQLTVALQSKLAIPSLAHYQVTRVGHPCFDPPNVKDLVGSLPISTIDYNLRRTGMLATEGKADLAVARALVCNLVWKEGERFERLQRSEHKCLLAWYHNRVAERHTKQQEPYDDPLGFDTVLNTVSRRRCLFTTSSGAIGWGPSTMRVGDEVHVLPGGKTPFILRATCPRYMESQLVGDCVLQGVMYGEAVEFPHMGPPHICREHYWLRCHKLLSLTQDVCLRIQRSLLTRHDVDNEDLSLLLDFADNRDPYQRSRRPINIETVDQNDPSNRMKIDAMARKVGSRVERIRKHLEGDCDWALEQYATAGLSVPVITLT